MSHPSKSRIRQSFERAAATYDSAAEVQRVICRDLLAGIPDRKTVSTRILDAGCGTGYALSLLNKHFPESETLALDFSGAMLNQVERNFQRIRGDLENLPFANASFDLYWSSLALQWCNLKNAVAEAQRVLVRGGQLAIASLSTGTFSELRHAFLGIDEHAHTIPFLTAKEMARMLEAAGFLAVDVRCTSKTVHYPDLRSMLRAVKAVGANQLGEGRRTSLLGKTAFKRAETAMETLREPAGLPLSYDIIYLYANA